MPNSRNYTSFILEDIESIKNFIGQISNEMLEYIEHNSSSKYVLFYKHLTHSDLAKTLIEYIDNNKKITGDNC